MSGDTEDHFPSGTAFDSPHCDRCVVKDFASYELFFLCIYLLFKHLKKITFILYWNIFD